MSARDGFPSLEKRLLRKIYESAGRPPIRLILKGRAEVSPPDALPVANIIISDRGTLLRLILDPEMAFGEGYMQGRIEVEGDLVAVLETAYRSLSTVGQRGWFSKMVSRWMALTQANSLRGSRKNIHHHYDLNTDFYRLWLDPELVYTCAYFPTPSATLEEAQLAKMDYVCRKLQLQPGERIVDAGCGWGALALHMAGRYGVNVRAFNISHEQILVARRRAKELGLGRRVEFIEDDYRNISGECDAFVSVGMLEHVGREHYRQVGSVIHRSLANSGRGLLHFIGRNQPQPLSAWTRKRIFPGAYMPTVREALAIFEPWDFSVLDVENLRPHYARTLENWLERFESSAERVSEMFGPEFVRAWRLYLAGAAAGFRAGTLQLFQVVFARAACRQIPWTRAHLYSNEPHTEQQAKWIRAIS
ncbi:MAG TPA: cyclopropane-fatty-acyl-phospholipid synthase family protein [Candidatus Acidoferrales bacterium]|nr:cyclopropane-fatty-acyl-phospholipid synthase family protein [Candidatus Acidoferrales bacterium]